MNIYFANRAMDILGMGSTKKISGFLIENDEFNDEIDSGVSTLSFTIHYNSETRARVKEMCAEGNYLLRDYNDDQGFFTIIETETNNADQTIDVYAEDAGLDLLNEVVGPFVSTNEHTIDWYINQFAATSGFKVNINEISEKVRRLAWDSSTTATQRIRSVADAFDNAEISYSFEIQGLKVINKFINVYEKRGSEVNMQLRMGKEIKTIREKRSIANLVTALDVTGGTPDGESNPITLIGYSYDDGDIYVNITNGRVQSRSALEKWSRYLADIGEVENFEGHIVGKFDYDTTSKATLCALAVAQLKKSMVPEVNYDVDLHYLPTNLKVGDYVNIIDDAGELYLSARVLRLTVNASIEQHSATFGDFLIKDSGISDRLQELAEAFAESEKIVARYTWIAYADDVEGGGISLNPTGKEYMGMSANHIVETVDITNPLVFTWSKIVGPQGEEGSPGSPGTPGVSPVVQTSKSGTTTTITITDATGTKTAEIDDGSPGTPGVSPVVQTSKSGTTTTITITDATGTKTAEIADGSPGTPGVSPVVQTSKTGGTTTITITDATGTKTAEIEDGSDSVTLTVTSSGGAVFETGYISTTLTAHVYMGGTELNASAIAELGTIKWYTISSNGSETYYASGQTLTLQGSLVSINIIAKLEDT